MNDEIGISKKKIAYMVLTAFIHVTIFIVGGYLLLNPGSERDVRYTGEVDPSATVEYDLITIETQTRTLPMVVRGRVRAENRLEIFPEVQGKVIWSKKPFRQGVAYLEGETILQLDDEEARLQLYASRSGFQTLIASLMPDIRLDFPEEMEAWEHWFNSLNPERSLPDIPPFENRQMQRFMTSRGVYDRFYQIKSAENRLEKFTIKAPFSGVLSSAKAEPGQSVGPQYHMGTLIDPDSYLLTATVQRTQPGSVSKGAVMDVSDRNGMHTWLATVSRINPAVDLRSQMVEIYLELSGENLKEGMFLEGVYETDDPLSIAEIPKSALLRTGHVYLIREGVVRQAPVEVMDVERATVWVTGLNDGDEIVNDAGKALNGRIIQ